MKKFWHALAGVRPEVSQSREMVGFILRSIGIIGVVLSFFALLMGRGAFIVFAPMLVGLVALFFCVVAWYPLPKKYEDD